MMAVSGSARTRSSLARSMPDATPSKTPFAIGTFTKRWPDAVKSLITGRFPMDAHSDLLLGRSGGIKNVIQLN